MNSILMYCLTINGLIYLFVGYVDAPVSGYEVAFFAFAGAGMLACSIFEDRQKINPRIP